MIHPVGGSNRRGKKRAGSPRYGQGDQVLVVDLEQAGAALAAADAHGDDRVADVAAPAAFLEDMAGEAGAGHAKGMADGDRAAVDVVLLRIDAEGVAGIEALAGEGFVQFPEVDVLD